MPEVSYLDDPAYDVGVPETDEPADVDRMIDAAAEGDEDDLVELAQRRPDLLRPHHRRLIDDGVGFVELFRDMDEETARYLVERIESGTGRLDWNLALLGARATDTAVETLRRWDREPPVWAQSKRLYPIRLYPHFGGWEFDRTGAVRPLTSPAAFALVADASTGPSASGGILDTECGGCGLALLRLFDVDLSMISGTDAGRVVVGCCIRCCERVTLFTEYDGAGGCHWAQDNGEPDFEIYEGYDLPRPRELWIGEPRPTPFAGSAWRAGGSTYGGSPDWIQDPEYPRCPRCEQTMLYLGMVTGDDIWGERAEGCYYAFVDPGCRLAAAVYQQS